MAPATAPTTGFPGLTLSSGDLSLEFSNTADWHASVRPNEYLNSYRDLAAWGLKTGLLGKAERDALVAEAERRPQEASMVLGRAISLREAIYRTFSAIAHGREPRNEDLTQLNLALAEGMSRLRVAPRGTAFVWEWTGGLALDRMIGPVVQAAALLLTSDELSRVGECADDRGCGWLFVDRSKNHSRRWCDMKGCGNRAKARRHYERSRGGA